MEKLKKCPFCGGEGYVISVEMHYWIRCKSCNADTDADSTLEGAIHLWNARKPMERILERIENEILEELSDSGDDWYTSEQINKVIEIVKAELN